MLGLVHNQVVRSEPVVITGSDDYRLEVARNGSKGRVMLVLGSEMIRHGVVFFKMSGGNQVQLDPRDGTFNIERGAKARIRAVFADRHLEVEL